MQIKEAASPLQLNHYDAEIFFATMFLFVKLFFHGYNFKSSNCAGTTLKLCANLHVQFLSSRYFTRLLFANASLSCSYSLPSHRMQSAVVSSLYIVASPLKFAFIQHWIHKSWCSAAFWINQGVKHGITRQTHLAACDSPAAEWRRIRAGTETWHLAATQVAQKTSSSNCQFGLH